MLKRGHTSTIIFTIELPNAGAIPYTLGNLPKLAEVNLRDNELLGAR